MERREAQNYGVIARDLTLGIGTKELISHANFAIYPGRKVALIGRNGSGKTTLLEAIHSIWRTGQPPEAVELDGSLSVSPETSIGYLPQSVQISFSGTVGEYLDSCAEGVSWVFNRYHELMEIINEQGDGEGHMDEYGELLEKMTELNAWDFPSQKASILQGLGLSEDYLRRDIKEVSGGEATKVALAGILLSSPNLILLDEPTNNLDPRSLLFLEKWISAFPFSLLLVSHDRDFLDKTIDEILEIDEATRQVLLFGGNYSFYAAKKEEMFQAQLRQFEEQQRKRKKLEEEAERLRKEALRFDTISKSAFYRAKGAGIARRASVQLQRVERELTKIPEPQPPKRPKITVFEAEDSKKGSLIEVKNIHFAYPGEKISVLRDIVFSVRAKERVGVIGPNGVGKSTLLKILIGDLSPKTGSVAREKHLRIGYLPQTLVLDEQKENVLEFFRKRMPMREEEAKILLGKVLFADPSFMRVGDFSFGELRRVEFVALFASKPDIIILDEPTNHLDVYTIEMLEEALKTYEGAVLAASHDQRFLKNIKISKIFVLKDGYIREEIVGSPQKVEEIFENTFNTS